MLNSQVNKDEKGPAEVAASTPWESGSFSSERRETTAGEAGGRCLVPARLLANREIRVFSAGWAKSIIPVFQMELVRPRE